MIRKIVLTISFIVILLFLFLLSSIIFFRTARKSDFGSQRDRLDVLISRNAVNSDLPDHLIEDSTPLNKIHYLATHNSYRIQSSALQLLFLDLGEPGEAEKLKYTHQPFYGQLDLGVRSLELDIRIRKGAYELNHVPLVDNRSHSPALIPALEEILLWSENNTGHIPLIILLEIKSDWMILDPALEEWNTEKLLELDSLFHEVLGKKVYKPSYLRGNSIDLRSAITDRGWPALVDLRDKIIIVHHEGSPETFSGEYLENPERSTFLMTEPDSPEASFMLRNDPFNEEIPALVEKGFIVRTMADSSCIKDPVKQQVAIDSGAQIISTDFPVGYPNWKNGDLQWSDVFRFLPHEPSHK